jgi:hypothetical protein
MLESQWKIVFQVEMFPLRYLEPPPGSFRFWRQASTIVATRKLFCVIPVTQNIFKMCNRAKNFFRRKRRREEDLVNLLNNNNILNDF